MIDEGAFEITNARLMALVLHGLQSGIVTLTVDCADPGIVLPPQFGKDGILHLDYGLSVPVPIPDLLVDRVGILATLSFARVPFETFVPWSAIRHIRFENKIAMLSPADLDALADKHTAGSPVVKREAKPRLRRVTEEFQSDAAEPTVDDMANEFDRVKTAEQFAAFGLRAVK